MKRPRLCAISLHADKRVQVPAVMMLVSEGRMVCLERVGDAEPQEAELDAARSSLTTGTVVRGDVYPNLASRFDF